MNKSILINKIVSLMANFRKITKDKKMRWYIVENKKKIASENFEGHSDHVEMSGEQVSAVITYSVKDGVPAYKRQFAFPMIRIQPNNTFGSYQPECNLESIKFGEKEQFLRVELDGVLTIFSMAGDLKISRSFYPSTTLPIFYEQIEITNLGNIDATPYWEDKKRFDMRIACEGYAVAERISNAPCRAIHAGETVTIIFAYLARLNNEQVPIEKNPLLKRRARITELLSQVDVTTGDEIVDTMFAFAKIRSGESLFRTEKGLIHCPGGMSYYAAVWCNDQCEYVAPWFAFTGDEKAVESTINSFRWYEPFMNDEYLPIPSSIIACGKDYWNGAGDRGDASMYLYGLSRFLLTRGQLPDERQKKALEWCAEYIIRKINSDGVVVSDTDELENRLSSGINLNTSSLSYGAFGYYATLLKRMEKHQEAQKFLELQKKIRNGIENYFGGKVSGYQTYHYHKNCDVIRAWNCLPVYMGILDRAKQTADSIDQKLWTEGSCRSTEGEKILWDRSALYYIASLFRMGDSERAWNKLREFCVTRLLGEHVPYAIEAYPEGGMRHLSAESGLFCRIITDGIINISFDEKGYILNPVLPKDVKTVKVNKIYLNGKYENLVIENKMV